MSDLEEELAPVREHFRGSKVTVGTVLAAYLRSVGLAPKDEPWRVAKEAHAAGLSFRAAAELARRASDSRHDSGSLKDLVVELSPEAAAASLPVLGFHHESLGPLPERIDESMAGVASPAISDVRLPAALDWFPKQFGPGDIDGTGGQRLLGQPNFDATSVLVREMAQNSWDARLPDGQVAFGLHLRRLTGGQVDALRDYVFTGACTGLHLREFLQEDDVWVLEVSDRGTVGLGGPVRNDLAVPPDCETNFIDLVLNVGAPRDVHLGGGTYGFGKTISYVASSCGTVLLWSRCRAKPGGAIEDRLIGSAMGPGFERAGHRYTGRHWWGRVVGKGPASRIEPLVGHEAAVLGAELFGQTFEKHQTGTSILIIQPKLYGQTPEDFANSLSQSVLWHLWPKLVPEASGFQPMSISVEYQGQKVPIHDPREHPVLAGFVQALLGVRAFQQQLDTGASPEQLNNGVPSGVEVLPIRSYKPKKLLGHLGLTLYDDVNRHPEEDVEDDLPRPPAHHVALMRHSAELVVRYREEPALELKGLQWAGVFKPVAATDDSFAAAEPPAHDDWIPTAVEDQRQKSEVRVALRRIRETVRSVLLPEQATVRAAEVSSGAALADALADLVGGASGQRPTRRSKSSKESTGKRRPRALVVDRLLGDVIDGLRRQALWVAGPDAGDHHVEPSIRVGFEGGSDKADGIAHVDGWSKDVPVWEPSWHPAIQERCLTFGPGQTWWMVIRAPEDMALDVSFLCEAVQ